MFVFGKIIVDIGILEVVPVKDGGGCVSRVGVVVLVRRPKRATGRSRCKS